MAVHSSTAMDTMAQGKYSSPNIIGSQTKMGVTTPIEIS